MSEKHYGLAVRDLEAEKIEHFDQVYAKLMDNDKDDILEERYVGKKRLASQPSLGTLARIKSVFEDGEAVEIIPKNASQSSIGEVKESDLPKILLTT